MIEPTHREEEFILAALASNLFKDRSFPDQPEDLDWDELYALLTRHRLATHYYVLGKSKHENWPASFRKRLLMDRYGQTLFGEQCLIHYTKILSAFAESNIPVIVLKGWALIQTLYGGDHSQRIFDDIDILVYPGNVDVAELILQKLGWQGKAGRQPGYHRRYLNAQAYFLKEQLRIMGRGFSVGLHWGLLHHPAYNPEQINIDGLFEHARPIKVGGLPALELSLEDHLVYSCSHIIRQHRSEDMLLRYYELAAVIAKAGLGPDWRRVVEQARLWKLIIPVQLVMKKIDDFWPGLIPIFALDLLARQKPRWDESFIHWWYQRTNYNPDAEFFLTLITMSGLRRRLSFLFEGIFPAPDTVSKHYGPAPGGFWPILYFQRYLNIVRNSLKKSDSRKSGK